jgi:ribonuclease BN (tRNA processing enzyme)
VRITVLGSGTAAPNPRRGAPGCLVEAGREIVLVDCGAGTLDRLLRAGGDPNGIDRVIFTHHHPDHFGEIGHLLFAARLPRHGRRKPLTVAGSGPLLAALRAYRQPFGHWLVPDNFSLTLHDLDQEPLAGEGVRISGYAVDHIPASRALRLEEESGAVLALSGDTDLCDGVVAAARNADLFVCEASFPEGGKKAGHLVPSEAGALARRAGARSLLLNHFYPECDEVDMAQPAAAAFGGPVALAEDGMVVDVIPAAREAAG